MSKGATTRASASGIARPKRRREKPSGSGRKAGTRNKAHRIPEDEPRPARSGPHPANTPEVLSALVALRANPDATPDEAREYDRKMFEDLMRESPLKHDRAKASLCEALVSLNRQRETLLRFVEAGKATGLEHRALVAVCSKIMAATRELQVTDRKEPGELAGGFL